jgi:hypothetical protein
VWDREVSPIANHDRRRIVEGLQRGEVTSVGGHVRGSPGVEVPLRRLALDTRTPEVARAASMAWWF